MKRIINGKSYNTDTSTTVARWEYRNEASDSQAEATLYVTRAGAFFAVHRWEATGSDNYPYEKTYAESFSRKELDILIENVDDMEIIVPGLLDEPPEAEAEERSSATISFRLPVALKERIDAAAGAVELSTNAWLMRCAERCLAGENEPHAALKGRMKMWGGEERAEIKTRDNIQETIANTIRAFTESEKVDERRR